MFYLGLPKEQKEQYGLMSAEKYFYLNQGGNCLVDGKTDREDLETLMSAMQVLGFSGEERDTIFKILVSETFFFVSLKVALNVLAKGLK